MRLGCLVFLFPFIEIAILFQVGRWIGGWEVVGWVAGTAILGIVLARMVGARALLEIRSEIARGGIPSRSLVDSAALLFGCICLVLPGLVTDLAGILLLLPISRRHLYRWIQGALVAGVSRGGIRIMTWGGGFRTRSGGGAGANPLPRDPRRRSAERVEGSAEEGGDNPDRPPRPGEIIQ